MYIVLLHKVTISMSVPPLFSSSLHHFLMISDFTSGLKPKKKKFMISLNGLIVTQIKSKSKMSKIHLRDNQESRRCFLTFCPPFCPPPFCAPSLFEPPPGTDTTAHWSLPHFLHIIFAPPEMPFSSPFL